MTKSTTLIALFTAMTFLSVPASAQKTAGEHVDDTTITARVKMALLEESVDDATDINVETSMGVVQLAGFVRSDEVRSTAASIARDVEGVKSVSNRLRIESGSRTAGRALDDTIVATKVKLELAESEDVSAGRINVEVRSGVVELSGFARSYAERDAAVEVTFEVDGVDDVINSIDITQ